MSELHTLTIACWCQPAAVDGHVNEDGSQPGKPDLDDTSRCPLGRCCATCGAEDDLAVGTTVSQVGVGCVTLCGSCAERGALPGLAVLTAMTSVAEHCGHLGIDLDEMAAAMAAERVPSAVRPLPSFLEEASC